MDSRGCRAWRGARDEAGPEREGGTYTAYRYTDMALWVSVDLDREEVGCRDEEREEEAR